MKTKLFAGIVFCLIFVGVGCSVNQPAMTPSATAVSQVTVPPETAVPPTVTAEPSPIVTETAVPTPTPIPTPIPTLPPPPTGSILFLWDSKQLPYSMVDEPVQSLYKALPGTSSAADWQIELLLDKLIGVPYSTLSPNLSKIGLTVLEDKNDDGYVSFETYNMGQDAPNLYVYFLDNGTFEQITDDYPDLYNPIWLPDNNTIISRQSSQDIVSVDIANRVTDTIFTSSETIQWILVAPNGQKIAVNFDLGKVSFLDLQSDQLVDVANGIGGFGVESAWSPNGRWLALTQSFNGLFFLINVETVESLPFHELGSLHYPAWSPDSQQLALIQDALEGSNLILLNPEDKTFQQLLSMPTEMRDLLWSPDGSQLAFSVWQDNGISLGVINVGEGEYRELWHIPDARRFTIPAWSPDSEWILFHSGQLPFPEPGDPIRQEQSGLYLIHKSGNDEAIQLLDSSKGLDPYSFFWLADTEGSP